MATDVTTGEARTPAARAMDDAIELAIEGRSPYPDTATFIDADKRGAVEAIKTAADKGRAVVLAYADGSTRVFRPEPRF